MMDPRLLGPLQLAGAPCSAARQRQLHWVAGELSRHWADSAAQLAADLPLGVLLGPEAVRSYLVAADAGQLRSRVSRFDAPGTPRPSSVASARTRRDCLALLTAAAQLPALATDRPLPPALHPHLDPQQARRTIAALIAAGLTPGAHPASTRAALVALLAHEHGLRTGEIAALTLADLTLPDRTDGGPSTVTWRTASPAAGPGPLQTATLAPASAALLARWLTVRATLAQPRTRHLLVSVHGNHDGTGTRRPAGLQLHPRGLVRAHARAIAALNDAQLGAPGHTPLPHTLGLLRPTDPAAP